MKTRDELNRAYDKHNPGSRLSNNRDERLYGKCGCRECGAYRTAFMSSLLSPLDQRNSTMGSINICDRCPAMVKGRALGYVQLKTSSDPDTMEVVNRELCPACIEELHTVLTTDVMERETRAFSEPFTIKPPASEFESATAEQMAAALFEKLMKANGQKTLTAE